jgi:hypothetical protein
VTHVTKKEEVRNCNGNFVGKPQRKKSFGRFRLEYIEDVKINNRENRCEILDSIQDKVEWLAFANTVMDPRFP